MAMGWIVNVLLSVGLKRVLNQERPVAGLKSDPGMPSSHAQSIFFTVVFAIASSKPLHSLLNETVYFVLFVIFTLHFNRQLSLESNLKFKLGSFKAVFPN